MMCFGCFALSAQAHEVRLEQQPGQASVLQLRYADGQPFAFERYELYRPAAQTPTQVGQTDAKGRVIFLPEGEPEWQLKAYSADGHGLNTTLRLNLAPEQANGQTADHVPHSANADDAASRGFRLAGGAGLLLACFFSLRWYLRRPKLSTRATP